MNGPADNPRYTAPTLMPMALPSDFLGTALVSIAMLVAMIKAAEIPCNNRKPTMAAVEDRKPIASVQSV
jgi:hypothetical protein